MPLPWCDLILLGYDLVRCRSVHGLQGLSTSLASMAVRDLVLGLLVPVRALRWANRMGASLALSCHPSLGLLLLTVLMLLRSVRDADSGLAGTHLLRLQVVALQTAPSKASPGVPFLDMPGDGVPDPVGVVGCPWYCFGAPPGL